MVWGTSSASGLWWSTYHTLIHGRSTYPPLPPYAARLYAAERHVGLLQERHVVYMEHAGLHGLRYIHCPIYVVGDHAPDSPYSVLLATSMASSSFSTTMRGLIGPNTSSRRTLAFSSTPLRTVGSKYSHLPPLPPQSPPWRRGSPRLPGTPPSLTPLGIY